VKLPFVEGVDRPGLNYYNTIEAREEAVSFLADLGFSGFERHNTDDPDCPFGLYFSRKPPIVPAFDFSKHVGETVSLVDFDEDGSQSGLNFRPTESGTVLLQFWRNWDGDCESGPGSSACLPHEISVEEAASTYAEAVKEGYQPVAS
tara:strand:- start:17 stop:457 length:441 start_codon:yes stop_codon:yes gene_type:complete